MKKWEPESIEDQLLEKYWNENKGVIFAEVPVGLSSGRGNWPKGTKVRRIDGIRLKKLPGIPNGIYRATGDFAGFLKNIGQIEVIEIKKTLNRLVIGQAIVGTDMIQREYGDIDIQPVIICSQSDPGMEWVCEKRGIKVFKSPS